MSQNATMPTVLITNDAASPRPGSRAATPSSSAAHSPVPSAPSKSTVARSANTKAIIEVETGSLSNRPAPKGRSTHSRSCPPTWSRTFASIGAKRAKVPKSREKTSTRLIQTSLP